MRKYGLTIDDLLAAEVVTADGEILQIDDASHPDLFWAVRGGGGNFGVVTRFRFRLHPLDTVLGGMLVLPATPETIAGFIAEAHAAPEDLSTIANVMTAPPMPFLPEEAHGKRVILALMCWAGELEAGERAFAPFRVLAEPLADMVHPMPYPRAVSARRRGLPADRGAPDDVRGSDRRAPWPRRSSTSSTPRPRRWRPRSSAFSAARWLASRRTPPRSRIASSKIMVNLAALVRLDR